MKQKKFDRLVVAGGDGSFNLAINEIIKNDLGDDCYNSIINLSDPVAAASIAQVHKAQINDNGTLKDVAIKILRPNIKKIRNPMMGLAVKMS